MINTNITCDCCGISKKESNNWYFVISYSESVNVCRAKSSSSRGENREDRNVLDACGEQCATKLIWENLK